MKITFYSNFFNHHQLPLAQALIKLGIEFTFVATEAIPEERLKLGYEDMHKKYDYVLTTYDSDENYEKSIKLCEESDIVIIGSAPEIYTKIRMQYNKIMFRYSERLHKQGAWRILDPILLYKMIKNNYIYKNNKLYLLAASAYAPYDYSKYNLFKNKVYKWGYFPKVNEVDIEKLLKNKGKNKKIKILWCARLIPLKHPEMMIELGKRLKSKGYNFEIQLIGNGKLEQKLLKQIKNNNLDDCIKMLGSLPYEKVRKYMDDANIFVFNSNRKEGWGAVMNEAMNSGCAIVAGSSIGSVPYLINNNKNGLIFKTGNMNDMENCVIKLLDDKELSYNLGKEAYFSMINAWSPENAAKRLIELYKYLKGENEDFVNTINENIPCSSAKVLSEKDFYNAISNENIMDA